MVESETVLEILVRTLTGESTVVSLSADATVEHLKLLLKQRFSPASNSPSFHLFYKGVKLRLQSKINVINISNGEFLLLVPFAKKEYNQTQKPDQSKTSTDEKNPLSKFADSVFSEMMEDLSYMRESGETKDVGEETGRFDLGISCLGRSEVKRKKGIDCDDLIMEILRSRSRSNNTESVLDTENCERLVKVFGSLNCLSDPYSGGCMLLRRAGLWGLGATNRDSCKTVGGSCLCPRWLKVVLRSFSFLNVVCAILQLRKRRTTIKCLEIAVGELGKFGVEFCMKDFEHLSSLSPKVVQFASEFKDGKSYVDGIIVDCSTPHLVQVKENLKCGCRGMGALEIFYLLKQREDSFRTKLWEAVESFRICLTDSLIPSILITLTRYTLFCISTSWLQISNANPYNFAHGNEKIATSSVEELFPFVRRKAFAGNSGRNVEMKLSRSSASSSCHSESCRDTTTLSPLEMLEHLRKGIGSHGQMVHVEDIDLRKAVYVEFPDAISQNMLSALNHIGVTKLYSHQAESVEESLSGKNVVVSTMTSSGKSLCYNLPVLEVLSQDMLSCALYLFPTKALAQDQLRALLVIAKELDCGYIGVYDGDTSQGDRKWLRDNARLMITNPDMLHLSILPYHRQFTRILSNLRFVVVDEAHAYKGAFGCHTAFILRRLRRLCRHVYGSDPSFVFSTATSANPREHCMDLANLPSLDLIQNDGSPAARKLFILWNPALNRENVSKKTQPSVNTTELADKKCSSPMEISLLFAEMVQHGLRCIAFCKTRKLCELVLCYTREILQETAPHMVDSISVYRAGYVAEERRCIERDFFGGKLCGVAATNALELGIDVGHIDVTLHLGFPGSIASLWQQAGRAGRREKPSLAVYVAFESPLDQYFMKNPRKLFGSPVERCYVDAQNQKVLKQHLVCAAVEHPLTLVYDENYFGPGLVNALESLKNEGYMSSDLSTKMWNYIGHEKAPSRTVSIRAIETERYQVVDENTKEILEEIEESKAFFQVYDGAVYMRQGKSYLVTSLNLSTKIALCQVADLNYYTRTQDCTNIEVLGGNIAYPVSKSQSVKTNARADPCTVTTTWYGFHRVDKRSQLLIDTVELDLPQYSYNSQAVWIPVPLQTKLTVELNNWDFHSGLHAASHALLNVVPLRIICNLSDLAPECSNPNVAKYFPERILMYDKHPGGVGMAIQVRPFVTELLTCAIELLTSCPCQGDTGCPHCIHHFACKLYNEVLHKEAAIMILKGVLDAEES